MLIYYCVWAVQPNNFPITKINPFKVPKYEKYGGYLDKSGEDKNLCHYFIFVIKIRTKIHMKIH